MRETELEKLIAEEFLGLLQDPRMERTRKHPLQTILVLALLAVICGADSFVAIERFGKAKREWLSSFLDLSGGVPSHDTIGRLLAMLDATALSEAFRRWTLAMAAISQEKLIAIDGKALRRSFKQAGDHAFVHMVSAWSASDGVVLGQVKTDDKSNEITAIPALLDLVDVRRALVTIDAAGTQTEIAQKIVDKGGDYMLAVKGNQPTLHRSVIEHFAGRDATLVRVESTRTVGAVEHASENRDYICSRRDLSAKQALHAVRSHWGIENSLRWVLDVAFREDDCRVRAGNGAANFSTTRDLALNLLKQRTEAEVGIKIRRQQAGWDHDFLLKVAGPNA